MHVECVIHLVLLIYQSDRSVLLLFLQLTRLDENRAKCQLALKSGKFYTSVSRVSIWGNHSTTQVRNLSYDMKKWRSEILSEKPSKPYCNKPNPTAKYFVKRFLTSWMPRSVDYPPWMWSRMLSGLGMNSPPQVRIVKDKPKPFLLPPKPHYSPCHM